MDPLENIRQTYFQECDELLLAMEEGLLAMQDGEADREVINAVFRAVHSIKGGGGAFGYHLLVAFAHVFETVLDLIRSDRLAVEADVVKVLLKAGDTLADHVAAARKGKPLDGSDSEVKAELQALSGEDGEDGGEAPFEFEGLDFQPAKIELEAEPATEGWTIRFAPHAGLYAKANEPALLIRELGRLGDMTVEIDLSRLPDLQSVEPEAAYFAWTITLKTAVQRGEIDEIFDFVAGDCDLSIEKIEAASGGEIQALPEPAEPGPAPVIDLAPELPKKDAAPSAPSPAETGGAKSQAEVGVKQTIRVDLDKVDRLVNIVGELVITQAMLSLRIMEVARNSLVGNALNELEHQLRDLQESVMSIRTQPVKSVFQRMPRLVRELAAQTNKQVRLVVEGEGTEVDKTVIERLGEPLTHMIRNAVDHGLETPEGRTAAGKPPEGTITLSAEHRGGRIVIELSDDGRGIDRERVKAKAIERELIPSNASLSDEEIDNLIFLPGFSTASQISDISGRGVGMDVVRRNIADLGGRVVIGSTPGKGSKFILTLPLTLAVLDGMIVAVGGQTYVLPLSHIIESLQPKAADIRPFGQNRSVLNIRNNYVPLVKIGELLNVPAMHSDPSQGVVILVESEGAGRLALAVDAILGQRQVVIKSFESNYRHIGGIAAATILGDGTVALILDVDGLASRCRTAMRASNVVELEQAAGGSHG